jgi:hypothetical protein
MAVHYSNGSGYLYDADVEKPVTDIHYYLRETDPTKYTRRRWWGGFSAKRKIERLGNYQIEFEDGRKAYCVIFNSDTPVEGNPSRRYHYLFYGRGRLGGRHSYGRA